MSSNELFGNLNYVDLKLTAGAYASADVFADCVGDFNASSIVVGVALQTAVLVAGNTNVANAQNITASLSYTVQGANTAPQVLAKASNTATDADTSTYRVYWVNRNLPYGDVFSYKLSTDGKSVIPNPIYPC